MTSKRLPLKVLLINYWLILALSGCASMQPALTADQMAVDPAPKETLVPGDVVDVKFFYTPKLNEQDQMIRPDGTVTLQLIGEVKAQGKTCVELRSELLKRHTPLLESGTQDARQEADRTSGGRSRRSSEAGVSGNAGQDDVPAGFFG